MTTPETRCPDILASIDFIQPPGKRLAGDFTSSTLDRREVERGSAKLAKITGRIFQNFYKCFSISKFQRPRLHRCYGTRPLQTALHVTQRPSALLRAYCVTRVSSLIAVRRRAPRKILLCPVPPSSAPQCTRIVPPCVTVWMVTGMWSMAPP